MLAIIAILIPNLLCKICSLELFSTAQIGLGLFILPISNIQKENFLGSFLMVVAMATFAVEDSVIKLVSSVLPVGQILFLLGVGGALSFFGLALILR